MKAKEEALFDFLLTLSKGKRHNVQSFYFHPGKRIVDLSLVKFEKLNSEHKCQVLYWLAEYSRKDLRVYKLAEKSLESKSISVIYMACRLLSYLQDENIIPKLEKLTNDKREKVKVDAGFAIKSIKNKNHLDFEPPYQWYPTILDNFTFENYKTEEEYIKAIDFYIIKQLRNEEIIMLKQIIGDDLYKR